MDNPEEQTLPDTPPPPPVDEKKELNKRLESVGWGLFLIMIGGISLVPDEKVPEGTWLIGVGLIMLGLNAARYFTGIKMSSGTIIIGAIALLSGIGDLAGLDLPVFPILLILIGINLLVKFFLEKKQA